MKKRLFIAFVVVLALAAIGSLALAQGTGGSVSGSGTVTGTWDVWEVVDGWDQFSHRQTHLLAANNSCLGTAAQGAGYQFSGSATLYNFSSYVQWWATPYFELGFGRGLNGMDQNLDGVIDWASESYTPALYVIAFGNGIGGYDVHLQERAGQRPPPGAIYRTTSGVGQPFPFSFDVVVQGVQATLTVNGVTLQPITLSTSQDYDAFNVNIADWRGGYWQNRVTGEIGTSYGSAPPNPGEADYSVSGAPIPEITVDIDIKPGSDPNCFNNDGHGVIPVAILGSETFDVHDINPATVQLAGLGVRVVGKRKKYLAHIEDVNGDGFDDLVVQIENSAGTFVSGSGTATLTGQLNDCTAFEGTDSICVVP
jgi:hypothetical protein